MDPTKRLSSFLSTNPVAEKSSQPPRKPKSVAVIGMDVYDHGLPPAEQEVPGSRADDHGQAEPGVEGHDDQHQKVSQGELQRFQN